TIGIVLDRAREPLDEALDLSLRQGAHEAIDRLAALKSDHGGNGTDPKAARNFRMLVNIHLDELDLAARSLDRFFENWRELLAGFAPGRPEIDQDRLTRRFRDDIGAEARRGGILYEQRRRSFRLSLAASLPAFLTPPEAE